MELDDFFPDDFTYKIVTNEIISNEKFAGKYRISIKGISDFKRWLNAFEGKTNTTWILKRSLSSDKRSTYILNRSYVCQHSSFRKRKRDNDRLQVKDKNCTASFSVKVKRNTKHTRHTDPYIRQGLNGILNMNFKHSHIVNDAEAWSWLKRPEETRNIFIDYFSCGISPSSALKLHENTHCFDEPELLPKSLRNPPKSWVYALYESWLKENDNGMSFKCDKNSKHRKLNDDSDESSLDSDTWSKLRSDYKNHSAVHHQESQAPCIIHMNDNSSDDCDDLKYLQIPNEVKDLFYKYFSGGLSVVEAMQLNEKNLKKDKSLSQFNPSERVVNYIYKAWCQQSKIPYSFNRNSGILSGGEKNLMTTSSFEDLTQTVAQNINSTSVVSPQFMTNFDIKELTSIASQSKENHSPQIKQGIPVPFEFVPQTIPSNSLIVVKNVELTSEATTNKNVPQMKGKLTENITALPKVDYIFDPIKNQLIAINSPSQNSVIALVNSTPVLVNSIHANPVFTNSRVSSVSTPHRATTSNCEVNSLMLSDEENACESSSSSNIHVCFSDLLDKSPSEPPKPSCQTTFSNSFNEPKVSDHPEPRIQKTPDHQPNIEDNSSSCIELNSENYEHGIHNFNTFVDKPAGSVSKMSTEIRELSHIYLSPQPSSTSSSFMPDSLNLLSRSDKMKKISLGEAEKNNLIESEETNFMSSVMNVTSISPPNDETSINFGEVEENECARTNNQVAEDTSKITSIDSAKENEDCRFFMSLLPEMEHIPDTFKAKLKMDILSLVLSTKLAAEISKKEKS